MPSSSLQLPKGNCSGSVSSTGYLPGFGLRNGLSLVSGLVLRSRVGVSSNDAQFGSFNEDKDVEAPSRFEFITSERVKVVAMLALALALCNADRVVMSVAIVPLSLSHGWSRSFAGIVQVPVLLLNCFYCRAIAGFFLCFSFAQDSSLELNFIFSTEFLVLQAGAR